MVTMIDITLSESVDRLAEHALKQGGHDALMEYVTSALSGAGQKVLGEVIVNEYRTSINVVSMDDYLARIFPMHYWVLLINRSDRDYRYDVYYKADKPGLITVGHTDNLAMVLTVICKRVIQPAVSQQARKGTPNKEVLSYHELASMVVEVVRQESPEVSQRILNRLKGHAPHNH